MCIRSQYLYSIVIMLGYPCECSLSYALLFESAAIFSGECTKFFQWAPKYHHCRKAVPFLLRAFVLSKNSQTTNLVTGPVRRAALRPQSGLTQHWSSYVHKVKWKHKADMFSCKTLPHAVWYSLKIMLPTRVVKLFWEPCANPVPYVQHDLHMSFKCNISYS